MPDQDDSAEESLPDTSSPDTPMNMLVLIMDGVRVEEVTSLEVSDITGKTGPEGAANIWATLGQYGVAVRTILHPGITITASSHVALFTGRTENYGTLAFPNAGPSLYRPERPTIFQLARQQLELEPSGARLIANTELLYDSTGSLAPYYSEGDISFESLLNEDGIPSQEDDDVFDRLREIISADHPRLLVANIHDVDRQGHAGHDGHYAQDFAHIDSNLAALWQWMRDNEGEWAKNTRILLTTDHGRHRVDLGYDPVWQEHGDSCTGCRELPFFLVGPGIPQGQVLDAPWSHAELNALIAQTLKIDVPYSNGLPLGFDPEQPTPSGDIAVSISKGSVAYQSLTGNIEHRSVVMVDGTAISDPNAWAAEAPSLATVGTTQVACWRELSIDLEADAWPWVARCMKKAGAAWSDIGFPVDQVSPAFQVSYQVEGDTLYAVWIDNPNAASTGGNPNNLIGVDVASWTEAGGWSEISEIPMLFPTDPSLAIVDGIPWLAAGFSPIESLARYGRQWAIGNTQTGRMTGFDHSTVLTTELLRSERPVLRSEGQDVWAAGYGYDEDSSVLLVMQSTDMAHSWGDPLVIDTPFLPHLSPVWDGVRLVWGAQLSQEEAGICSVIPGAGEPVCVGLGSAWLDSFAIENGVGQASIYRGDARWERVAFSLAALQ